MLNRLRGHLPTLSTMLDDIGRPSPRELARVLDVTERTVRRWLKEDDAPKPVLLAIFWLTSWGQQTVDAETYNLMRLHAGMASALRSEVDALRARLASVGRIADFGAANDPAPGVPRLVPVVPPGELAPAPTSATQSAAHQQTTANKPDNIRSEA